MTIIPTIRRILCCIFAAAIAVGGCSHPAFAAAPANAMIKFLLNGQKVEGSPIRWSESDVHLLGRDGRLWKFEPDEATDFKQTSARFQCYPPSEFRAALLRELGGGYEVSGTGHYLIVHPRGQRDKWADRFEELYRSFVHYFSIRGLEPSPPLYPLVGVVCQDRAEFDRQAMAQFGAAPGGVLGYYNIETNWIVLYDMGAKADSADWKMNASVLIHEATHQTAFNTGIHSRYCLPPKWVAEGLAMLFEAPGVYDSRAHTQPGDRVNRERLKVFQEHMAARHKPELLAKVVATDEIFGINASAAYAESWALSFFLVETMPRKYAEYLKRTAARPPFQDYTPAQRVADFTAVFGSDWRMLEARFLRFMSGVR
jgi:hypothetical protein